MPFHPEVTLLCQAVFDLLHPLPAARRVLPSAGGALDPATHRSDR